MSTERQ